MKARTYAATAFVCLILLLVLFAARYFIGTWAMYGVQVIGIIGVLTWLRLQRGRA